MALADWISWDFFSIFGRLKKLLCLPTSMKHLVKIVFLTNFLLVSLNVSYGGGIQYPEPQTNIRFTENKSQWDKKILYRAQLDGGALFMENNCFTYNFYDKQTLRSSHVAKKAVSHDKIRSHAFRMNFEGALPTPVTIATKPTHDVCNYFIGNDQSKWASGVKNYKEVVYEKLYPFIDLQVLGMQNSIKYNFIVAPGGNTKDIQLVYEGLDEITLQNDELRMKTSLNEIIEQKPYAFQVINARTVEVPCEFVLKKNTVSFRFPKGYDKNYELIIDPILVFACSSGSTADNFGMTATYDAVGNLYGAGTCFDMGYPTTLGAFDPTYNGVVAYGRTDVVVTKFDSSGTFLQYSTYIGGALGTEVVSSLIVSTNNELMLFGATGSTDFPITAGAYDATFAGGDTLEFYSNGTIYNSGTDLYVARFNSTGTALIGSTFVGGTENEGTNNSPTLYYNYGDYYRGEIQTDYSGNCYVTSCTYSANFPTTPGCFQPIAGGGMDGVVFKMNPTLTAMTWSTYLAGMADDGCNALTVDLAQNVYVTGGTSSANFPVTAGVVGPVYSGGISDGFITKIRNDGAIALSSTFVGTPFYDQNFLIQLDNNLDVYIVGQTEGNMPVSAGVYSNANSKQFIWQLNNGFTSTLFTTNFGNGNGTVNISPSAFLVDTCGNIYVCGWGGNILMGTATVGMPLTPDAHQSTTDGFNFHLMVLAPDAVSLIYATYFGGGTSWEHVDGGTSRFDKRGIVYQGVCAGCPGNDDFPVTPGSWPNTGANVNHSTNCNMGVFKFDFQAAGVSANANITPNDTICTGEIVAFNNASSNAFNYEWNFGDGSPVSNLMSPTHVFNVPGTFDVTLIAFDSAGCIFSDTTGLTIIVLPRPVLDLGNDTTLCVDPAIFLDAGNPGCFYTWSTGATTQTITATDTSLYWVVVSNNVCEVSDSINISQFIPPTLGLDTTLCEGLPVLLDATSIAATYLWSTGQTSATISPTVTGSYWVEVDFGICSIRDTINVTFIPYPIPNLGNDTTFCETPNYVLDAGNPGYTFAWSTGAITQTITATDTLLYWVTIDNAGCIINDSIQLSQFTAPEFGLDTTLCAGQSIILDAQSTDATYLWSTGHTGPMLLVVSSGQYWVEVDWGTCFIHDTINVTFLPYPVVSLPPAVRICPGTFFILDAGAPAESYSWSSGQTTQTIDISTQGLYIVDVSNGPCHTYDSTILTVVSPIAWEENIGLCNVDKYTLDAGSGAASYLWSTGATTESIEIEEAGMYWVVMNSEGCILSDTVTIYGAVGSGILWFPNSFSPNHNGLNDVFIPKGIEITYFHMMIFDRWGELIYETEKQDEPWDGTYKGQLCKQDVYVWKTKFKTKCEGDKMKEKIGHVTLVR